MKKIAKGVSRASFLSKDCGHGCLGETVGLEQWYIFLPELSECRVDGSVPGLMPIAVKSLILLTPGSSNLRRQKRKKNKGDKIWDMERLVSAAHLCNRCEYPADLWGLKCYGERYSYGFPPCLQALAHKISSSVGNASLLLPGMLLNLKFRNPPLIWCGGRT